MENLSTTRRHRQRRIRLAAVVAGVVMSVPAPAWAHPEFVGNPSVPPGSDQKLTLDVPEEKGPDVHNAKVVFVVPAGFSVSGCDQKPEWECGVSGASNGRTLVTYTRSSGANPDGRFSFGVRTPDRKGDYPFQTNQSYSDNTTVRWSGPPDSDTPAPVLKVS